jgi:hypothetical protein
MTLMMMEMMVMMTVVVARLRHTLITQNYVRIASFRWTTEATKLFSF